MFDFFAIDDAVSGQVEPLDLAQLELVLRNQPEGQSLRLFRYEFPDTFTPRPEVWDATVSDDLTLTVGADWETYEHGLPVEELSVVHEGGRIRITDASGAPVARCDNCNGLIRAADPACPHCSWAQWATADGFLARPLPTRKSAAAAVDAGASCSLTAPCGHASTARMAKCNFFNVRTRT